MNHRDWLLESMQEMPVIDTHEHLESEAAHIACRQDFISLYMTQYASCDVMTAGLSPEKMGMLQGDQMDVREKWDILKPYWALCRHTAFFRVLQRANIDLFGISHVGEDTFLRLNDTFRSLNQPGWYRQILKDRCHIEYCVMDDLFIENPGSMTRQDPLYYREAANYDLFLGLGAETTPAYIMGAFQRPFSSLREYLNLIGDTAHTAKRERGIVAIKSRTAYSRTLQFDDVPFATAEVIFDQVLSGQILTPDQLKPLQDHLMHALLGFAGDLSLPVQMHTGLQAGLGCNILDSRPTHLIPVFQSHPGVRFDVFHTGYPYGNELTAISKGFPNVFIDMCWVHVISQEYAVSTLEEMLEMLPYNKILGFGGDYIYVEGTYAHLQMAKENIAEALSSRIDKGRLDRTDALSLASCLLYGNAKALFGP